MHAALILLACRVGDLAPVAPLARGHFLGQPVHLHIHVILVQVFLMVPNEPGVLLEGAPIRLEVLPNAFLGGAHGRLFNPGLQRNAAEPALFRSSEK